MIPCYRELRPRGLRVAPALRGQVAAALLEAECAERPYTFLEAYLGLTRYLATPLTLSTEEPRHGDPSRL